MPIRTLLLFGTLAALVLTPQLAVASPDFAETSTGKSNLEFLFAGFAAVWASLFAYVFYISHKQQELRREIEDLQERLLEHKSGSARS